MPPTYLANELSSSTTTTTQIITDIQREIVQIGEDVDNLENTAASIPVTLLCRITQYQVGAQETRAHDITFSAADCGGKLPDATYVGVLSNTEVCGADESWEAKQPMFGQSAGVTFWTLGDCGADASNPASRAANILVVYFKVVQ